MKGYFFKAFLCCFFSLLLLFAYEAAYPFFPILHNLNLPIFGQNTASKTRAISLLPTQQRFWKILKA
jgi:hypothetical protein